MTFREWLKRQVDRDDPIGDLAQDYVRSGRLPERVGLDWMVAQALDEAEEEYRSTWQIVGSS